jgi:hypothetical protein
LFSLDVSRFVKFDVALAITPAEYRASSDRAGYTSAGPAVCITTPLRGRESFLSVGEGEAAFAADAEFLRLKSTGQLRVFDPFRPEQFEPENAALVVQLYVLRAHDRLRASLPAFVRSLALGLVDRCAVTARLSFWHSIAPDLRDLFRARVLSRGYIMSFTTIDI